MGFQTKYGKAPSILLACSSSRLNAYLLSNVGIQPKGTPLTVLSLMARMEVDPWEEAERLSSLPSELAVSWMTTAIGRSSLSPRKLRDTATLASLLIDRLHAHSNKRPSGTALTGDLSVVRVCTVMVVIFVVISMFLIIVLS